MPVNQIVPVMAFCFEFFRHAGNAFDRESRRYGLSGPLKQVMVCYTDSLSALSNAEDRLGAMDLFSVVSKVNPGRVIKGKGQKANARTTSKLSGCN